MLEFFASPALRVYQSWEQLSFTSLTEFHWSAASAAERATSQNVLSIFHLISSS